MVNSATTNATGTWACRHPVSHRKAVIVVPARVMLPPPHTHRFVLKGVMPVVHTDPSLPDRSGREAVRRTGVQTPILMTKTAYRRRGPNTWGLGMPFRRRHRTIALDREDTMGTGGGDDQFGFGMIDDLLLFSMLPMVRRP